VQENYTGQIKEFGKTYHPLLKNTALLEGILKEGAETCEICKKDNESYRKFKKHIQ